MKYAYIAPPTLPPDLHLAGYANELETPSLTCVGGETLEEEEARRERAEGGEWGRRGKREPKEESVGGGRGEDERG